MINPIALQRQAAFDQLDVTARDQQSDSRALPGAGTVKLRVIEDFATAEAPWRTLEANASGSVYQRFDWCKVWFDTVCGNGRTKPLILLLELSGRPALLVPLYRNPVLAGFAKAEFMGDKHANVRVPLVTLNPLDRAQVSLLARNDGLVVMIIKALKDGGHADLLALKCLPETYGGDRNLLTVGALEPCNSVLFSGELQADFQALTMERRAPSSQRKYRKHTRKLASLGDYSLEAIDAPARLDEALDAFFAQKSERLAQSQIHNIFEDRANEQFARRLAHESLKAEHPMLRLYALQVNGQIIAVAGGGMLGDRFSMAINSISERPEHIACSPGRIAITMVVEQLCAQGYNTFDMGVGENRYKHMWCSPVPLWVVKRALSPAGLLLLGYARTRNALVAVIKRSPAATRLARSALYRVKKLLR